MKNNIQQQRAGLLSRLLGVRANRQGRRVQQDTRHEMHLLKRRPLPPAARKRPDTGIASLPQRVQPKAAGDVERGLKRNRPALGRKLAHRILTGKKAGRRVSKPFFKV